VREGASVATCGEDVAHSAASASRLRRCGGMRARTLSYTLSGRAGAAAVMEEVVGATVEAAAEAGTTRPGERRRILV